MRLFIFAERCIYLQLPNLRGQAWASMGKSSSCMGHSAEIVSLKEEAEDQYSENEFPECKQVFNMMTSNKYIVHVAFSQCLIKSCNQQLGCSNHSPSSPTISRVKHKIPAAISSWTTRGTEIKSDGSARVETSLTLSYLCVELL